MEILSERDIERNNEDSCGREGGGSCGEITIKTIEASRR